MCVRESIDLLARRLRVVAEVREYVLTESLGSTAVLSQGTGVRVAGMTADRRIDDDQRERVVSRSLTAAGVRRRRDGEGLDR